VCLACTGAFARAHQTLLDLNGWDTLRQEVLISTPRRFGKTYSVSMFVAAALFAARNVEISIYSTCKRISQKLLKNVQFFLHKIHEQLKLENMKVRTYHKTHSQRPLPSSA
jgi:pullulanase/glycogen debranching enzyme